MTPAHSSRRSSWVSRSARIASRCALAALILAVIGALVCGATFLPIGLILASLGQPAGGLFGVLAVILAIVALALRCPDKKPAVIALALGVATVIATSVSMGRSLRDAKRLAREVLCRTNLRAMGMFTLFYAQEHDEAMPPDLESLLGPNGLDTDCLKCPSAESGRSNDYIYAPPPVKLGEIKSESKTLLACDRRGNHPGGRQVVYVDGSVAWLTEAEFQDALAGPENAKFAAALKKAEGP